MNSWKVEKPSASFVCAENDTIATKIKYEFMRAVPVRTLDSNKRIEKSWGLSLSKSNFRTMTTSLSEGHERETSGFRDEFIGKTTNYVYMYICVNKQQSVGSSSVHLFTGGWEAARPGPEVRVLDGVCWMRGATSQCASWGPSLNSSGKAPVQTDPLILWEKG